MENKCIRTVTIPLEEYDKYKTMQKAYEEKRVVCSTAFGYLYIFTDNEAITEMSKAISQQKESYDSLCKLYNNIENKLSKEQSGKRWWQF